MELKTRLSSLEHQINSLQSLLNKENYSKSANDNSQENLKAVLMKLKMEHENVLRGIEKALELVECSPSSDVSKTPEKSTNCFNRLANSPSPRLRDKINSALNGTANPRHQVITSSPLSSAVEKSHITFDILNELEQQQFDGRSNPQKRKVHFVDGGDEEMSVASREYLRKYGLI